jgi:hypothetical protein
MLILHQIKSNWRDRNYRRQWRTPRSLAFWLLRKWFLANTSSANSYDGPYAERSELRVDGAVVDLRFVAGHLVNRISIPILFRLCI